MTMDEIQLDYWHQMIKVQERIAEALEHLNEKLIPILARVIGDEIKGETSVDSNVVVQLLGSQDKADSKPKTMIHSPGFDDYVEPKPLELPKPKSTINWIIHEGNKYKDCKYCDNLVSWNHDTNNYDHFNRGFKYLYPRCNTGG